MAALINICCSWAWSALLAETGVLRKNPVSVGFTLFAGGKNTENVTEFKENGKP
ncbi:MAG: hypothetical protein NWF04_09930 [Candidatus Bathyarchaeota archaeon]|nr:hypothetical protein [Candidatus Bathyarchaeota archaeon]